MPELSYCIAPYPQVLGPANSATTELTANANARARVILLNIFILLRLKPEVASADEIGERDTYSALVIPTEVRSVQVFVCYLRGVPITSMSVIAATNERSHSAGDVPLLQHEFRRTGPRRDCCHDIAWCRREASLRQVGSSELGVTRQV